MLNSTLRDYLILFGVAGVSVGLDQWTKALVREHIAYGSQWMPEWLSWLTPYARFVHWSNSGAAFGMFQDGNQVFKILAFIVIGAIIYYYPQVEKESFYLKFALGLQLGGATGNLIDRLLNNEVTDFISVGAFPVFNIADASISIGVVILLLGVWIQERKEKANKQVENGEQLSVDSHQ